MPNYKVTYFNGKGRAESIRFMFAAAGVKYEDCRIDPKDWPALKPNTPFGTVPILEVDGRKLADSGAICRFLADKYGFMGKNPVEKASIDACCEVITDLREKTLAMQNNKDPEKEKAEKLKIFREKTVPDILTKLENCLKKNKGGDKFFFGDQLSLADIHFCCCIDQVLTSQANVLNAFPKLSGLNERVKSDKKIAKWLENRPQTEF